MSCLDFELTNRLRLAAEQADRSLEWPYKSWQLLQQAGALGWSIPAQFSGTDLNPVERLRGMEEIAACCLTTAFILSQREAAVRHLLKGPQALRERWLEKLATGGAFLTVGLSQLSTSRQHTGPALRVHPLEGSRYRLEGEIPWVTGADQADAILVGGTLADGRQLLVLIPADRLKGMIEPPLPLGALGGSRTSLVKCHDVLVSQEDVVAEPAENRLGTIGGGGLDTSCLALGLAAAAAEYIRSEAEKRTNLLPAATRFDSAVKSCRDRLHQLATLSDDPQATLDLRRDCTQLTLRASQAALTVAKGIGFVSPHPAQRWARQANFFLVWSCPRPVTEAVLADLIDF